MELKSKFIYLFLVYVAMFLNPFIFGQQCPTILGLDTALSHSWKQQCLMVEQFDKHYPSIGQIDKWLSQVQELKTHSNQLDIALFKSWFGSWKCTVQPLQCIVQLNFPMDFLYTVTGLVSDKPASRAMVGQLKPAPWPECAAWGLRGRFLLINPSSSGRLIIIFLPTECWDISHPIRWSVRH